MDKCHIILVTFALCYVVTARSYHEYPAQKYPQYHGGQDNNFGKLDWGNPHGHGYYHGHHGHAYPQGHGPECNHDHDHNEHYPWEHQNSDENSDSSSWSDSSENSWNWNDGYWSLPDQDGRPSSPSSRTTSSPAPTPGPSSQPSTLDIVQCMRSCPVTPEYNPVCGTNNVTYNNPGRLVCAKNCGVDVNVMKRVSCAAPDPANSAPESSALSTSIFQPTRHTTVDLSSLNNNANSPAPQQSDGSIPDNILASAFPQVPQEEDPVVINFDVRIKEENETSTN